jgi:hypothetical protein
MSGCLEYLDEATYTNRKIWFVGLSHFQHSAAIFLLKCTPNVVSTYIKGVAELIIYFYDAKIMNSAAVVEHNCDLLKWYKA